jgi:hypothetical protein
MALVDGDELGAKAKTHQGDTDLFVRGHERDPRVTSGTSTLDPES